MKKQHANRWTSLWLALIMVLVSILGPIPAVMAQDFDPAEPAPELISRSLFISN